MKTADKVVTQTTLDISKEILDQIEIDEHCKVCYKDDQPPLIRIMRVGKKDIITQILYREALCRTT